MKADPMDPADLQSWIGRQEQSEDQITTELAKRFGATLDFTALAPSDALLGIHWCVAPTVAPMAELSVDGHPERGGFLPPIPLPRRMWAGGELVFTAPLHIGDTVSRHSTIQDIAWKNGRTGPLCIVTVHHDYSTAQGLVLRERQDIVYRAMSSGPDKIGAARETAQARWKTTIPIDPVLLFRYSALTFNAHRIHYDRRYCIEDEHYPGLVVHGPLQATLLLRFAGQLHGQAPRKFTFRSMAPIFDGGGMTLNAAKADDGLLLWTADQAEHIAMSARAQW